MTVDRVPTVVKCSGVLATVALWSCSASQSLSAAGESPSSSIRDYTRAIEADPADYAAYYGRAFLKAESGDFVGAIEDYSTAIALNPGFSKAYRNRAVAKGESGDLAGSIRDLDEAIRLDPNDSVAYYNRGVSKQRLGDESEAMGDFHAAIRIDPNHPAAYRNWRYLADGDGGDENLKDYPIEENPELTIRSVVHNPLLYQEGWGVDRIKHSLTYSGGLSRGCVRGWAPATRFGFVPWSPLTRPAVVAVAEAIPFAELAQGSHARLYDLKGEVVRRGIAQHLGVDMPTFPKRRFQEGIGGDSTFASRFGFPALAYRRHFEALHATATKATTVV